MVSKSLTSRNLVTRQDGAGPEIELEESSKTLCC